MTAPMAAITIWQPWASLIAAGCKPFEFRGWAAPYRIIGQRIAIHAGARKPPVDEIRDLLIHTQSSWWRETGLVDRDRAIGLLAAWTLDPKQLPLSSILCTARLGTPIRNRELGAQLGIEMVNDSDREEHSNWGWPLTDIEVLTPIVPARGAQGFWRWTPPPESSHG